MDIESFRVRQISPAPATKWHKMSPQAWAEALLRIRRRASRALDIEEGILLDPADTANAANSA
jgi:hypothetical protein